MIVDHPIGRPTAQHPGAGAARSQRRRRRQRLVGRYLGVHLAGVLFAAFGVLPILWGISTSLKRSQDVYDPSWIPHPLTAEHYLSVLHNAALVQSFFNTLSIATATTLLAMVVGVLGAYGFSRYRFPGRSPLLWSVLFTQLFPRVVVLVPFFIILRNLNMMNTYQGLVLVYLMVVFPVAIWLVKGFFDGLPVEIEQAAVIDGCSLPRLLWYVVIPMARPAIASVAMYSFVLAWNEFLFALVFTSGVSKRPMSVALAFFIDDFGIRWGELAAASLLMSIPSIVIFTLCQKMLVRGLSDGALKG